jgi:hypothetical protein
MKSSVIEAYESQLRKLESLPFEMGLPEEIDRIKKHLETLRPDPKGQWDGDLGCYDESTSIEYIDL